ncbi:Nucleotide-binding universal stress protein, UspA family [Natronoarchaeum philippinense]|uniref:Nucleotide-binding universal stress protein, UspA family n=1 Tax=Natronoarchaeum philippinense TaxID=558529 RepID=A0A285N8F2_NATPI|nr:universal stress protein [Natronoarchaeum philippinense]SNZ05699.1 Nucleotide-binding universal stress protein, UspA family [Natronoarchaeum philippinense]
MYETVLLATDGSACADRAAERAIDLASTYGADLHAVYAIETRTAYDTAIVERDEVEANLRAEGESILGDVADRAAEAGVEATTAIEMGVPADVIEAYAEAHDADVIVLGRRGRSELRRALLGSTTDALVRESPVPVMIVGEDEEAS